jgi:precorrin-6B methylase 2
MESSKRTRVVLLGREKKAIKIIMRNKQKSDNNGKKLQIRAKAAPVLLTKNWCSFL